MVGNYSSIHQDTTVQLDCPVEYSDKEGDFSPDDKFTPQEKYTWNKLCVIYKFRPITEYQEIKLVAVSKGKKYT